MQIGPFEFATPLVLAPMAGVTDRPFRNLCRRLGADLAVSEMITSNSLLWATEKTRRRLDQRGENQPRSVQIAGAEPTEMAAAARRAVQQGAQIIDINMGCPAKKVCNRWSGSALLRDEALVERILTAVVAAVRPTPVTLKIRTGWSRERRNALQVSRIAEACGIAALAIHGRTREDRFTGQAEYDTIAAVKQSVAIPVLANGDIDGPHKAAQVLAATGADGLLIGRAAQGRPWIFGRIREFLDRGRLLPDPAPAEVGRILLDHLQALYDFYGEYRGVRVARKHIGWYCHAHSGAARFRQTVMRLDTADAQRDAVAQFFATTPALGIEAA